MEILFRDQQHIVYEIRLIAIREVSSPFDFGSLSNSLERLAAASWCMSSLLINLRSPRDYVGPPFLRSSVPPFVHSRLW